MTNTYMLITTFYSLIMPSTKVSLFGEVKINPIPFVGVKVILAEAFLNLAGRAEQWNSVAS